MAEVHLAKWGNSLALRLPRDVARDADLNEGDCVSIEVTSEKGVLVRAKRPAYTLQELIAGITPKNRHRETEWGKATGKELW
jgi:antitoxin MazE